MPDAFISYSRRDAELTRRIRDALADADTWLDEEDIPMSADWWRTIQDGIERSNAAVALISPNSLRSPICALEIDYALRHKKRLIPVMLHETDPEQAFADLSSKTLDDVTRRMLDGRDLLAIARNNWLALAQHNWVRFDTEAVFDASVAKLREALATDLDHVGDHTRLLVRALEWERNRRERSFLLSGVEITQAETWLANAGDKSPEPAQLHTEYILASRAAANTRQRNLLTGVSGALAVVALLAVLSFVLFRQSEANRVLADQNAATSDANALLAQDNEATAVSALATSERRADEAQSMMLVSRIDEVALGNPAYELAIVNEAARIDNPPARVEQALADRAYETRVREQRFFYDGSIRAVAYSPAGDLIATTGCTNGCATHELTLWDADGERVDALELEAGPFHDLAFNDDTLIAVGCGAAPDGPCETGQVVLWNFEDGDTETLDYFAEAFAVAVSADGARYAVGGCAVVGDEGCEAGEAHLYDAATNELLQTGSEFSTTPVYDLAFHPDGDLLAFATCGTEAQADACTQGQFGIWDLAADEASGFLIFEDAIRSVAFSPDGATLAAAGCAAASGELCFDGAVIFLDTETTDSIPAPRPAHATDISDIAFGPEGSTFYSIGAGLLVHYDIATGDDAVRTFGVSGEDTHLAVSPDGREVLMVGCADDDEACGGGLLQAVDTFHGAQELLVEDTPSLDDVLFLPGNETLLTSGCAKSAPAGVQCAQGALTVWDAARGTQLEQVFGHEREINRMALLPDGETLVSGGQDGTLLRWDLNTYEATPFASAHEFGVSGVVALPDGERVLTSSFDDTLGVWDVASGERLATYTSERGSIFDVAVDAAGETVLVANQDGTVEHVDLETMASLAVWSGEHDDWVRSVAFSADGTLAVSGSEDGSVVVWDVGSGSPLRRMEVAFGSVYTVFFTADDMQIVLSTSAGGDGVQVRDVATGEVLRRFPVHQDTVWNVAINTTGTRLVSVGADDRLIVWRLEGVDDLREWFAANRPARDLTCDERLLLNARPFCEE